MLRLWRRHQPRARDDAIRERHRTDAAHRGYRLRSARPWPVPLSAHGHRVRALVRKTSDRRNLDGLALEQVEGDLGDGRSLAEAVRGCRCLFHVAADYRLWVPDPERMLEINVAGTRALLEAACAAGVERVVYTSSVAALGLTEDGMAVDETTRVVPERIIGVYKRSKYLAEQEALAMAGALDVVVVNPSTPVGPGDIKPTPTGRMIADAAAGRIPAFVDTGLNIVHVDDVAEGPSPGLCARAPRRALHPGRREPELARALGHDRCPRRAPAGLACACRSHPWYRSLPPPRRWPGSPARHRS